MPEGVELTEAAIRSHWLAQRNMVEFLAAQPGSRYWIAESDGKLVGFARVVGFDGMEELTELMVDPEHQREGVGRALLDRVLAGRPDARTSGGSSSPPARPPTSRSTPTSA